jgi:hypothetical protein
LENTQCNNLGIALQTVGMKSSRRITKHLW